MTVKKKKEVNGQGMPGMADFFRSILIKRPSYLTRSPQTRAILSFIFFLVKISLCVTVSGTDESDLCPKVWPSKYLSGPILAVLVHSLLRSPAKIGPEIRFSFRFALPAGMLFTKRKENRALSQVILEGNSKSNENHR